MTRKEPVEIVNCGGVSVRQVGWRPLHYEYRCMKLRCDAPIKEHSNADRGAIEVHAMTHAEIYHDWEQGN